MDGAVLPLAGVTVVDFSTLLPGPLATLILAEAGAEVVKVERPGGDPIRRVGPFTADGTSVRFMLLNRGKRSVTLDLKTDGGRQSAQALAATADVVVEQFRPGVMNRLGLGYAELSQLNPRLVYCSITGYGQTGPRAARAGHDLNYAGDAGLLSMVTGAGGVPAMPSATYADIGGGSYPAVMNILLALIGRDRTGHGAHIDVAMSENLLSFVYWGVGNGERGHWPRADAELLTGASPRYRIYPTADGRHIAVAALEQPFWDRFCALIGLDRGLRDDRSDPEATRAGVAARLAAEPAAHWERVLGAEDTCVTVVRELATAVADEHLVARGVFARRVGAGGGAETIAAMHLPIDGALRDPTARRDAPGPGPQAPVEAVADDVDRASFSRHEVMP